MTSFVESGEGGYGGYVGDDASSRYTPSSGVSGEGGRDWTGMARSSSLR